MPLAVMVYIILIFLGSIYENGICKFLSGYDKMANFWRYDKNANIVIATIAPLIISYFFTDYKWDRAWYASLKKAPLNPPSWIFPVVWPILYLMMGYASGLVVEKVGWFSLPILFYVLQLIVNITWSKIFFINKDPQSAFKQLLLLLILVSITIYLFYKENKTAAYLLIPYLMWLLFATYLNGYIVANN